MTAINAVQHGTNAELIDTVRRLYPLDGPVLDMTYGKAGGFWKKGRPDELTTIGPEDGIDYTATGFAARSFAHVVLDPAYVAPGGRKTSTIGAMNDRYGMHTTKRTPAEQWDHIQLAIAEAHRLLRTHRQLRLRGLLWFKCMNYVSSGRKHWFTFHALDALDDAGFDLIDVAILDGHPGPQPTFNPDGTPRRHVHLRENYSALMIARKRP